MAFQKGAISWQVFKPSFRRGINRTGKIIQIPFSVCFPRFTYFLLFSFIEILKDKGWRQPLGGAKVCHRTVCLW